jgi:hypothetical protein
MNTNWYFSRGEETEGPVTEEQLIALITRHLLAAEHFVTREGTEEWQTIGDSEFAAHLPPVPQVAPVAARAAAPAPGVAKRSPVGLIVGVVAVLLALGAGAYFLIPRGGSKAGHEATPKPKGTPPAAVAGTPQPATADEKIAETPPATTPPPKAAAEPAASPLPKVTFTGAMQYFGKTFEECEKLLGEHTSEEKVEQPVEGVARHYKSPVAQTSQLRLIQPSKTSDPQRFPNAVGHITYYFAKGSMKQWRDAFTLLALPLKNLDEKIFPEFTVLTGLPEGIFAQWISAEADPAANLKEDMLVLMPDPNFNP